MKKNRKKLLMLLLFIGVLLMLTGCTSPTDESGHIIQITTDTTFKSIFSDESWFSALFVYPLSQAINHLAPSIGVLGAVALVTFIVQGVILLFTLKSTIQTQQMQLIQPEINKIQRKYEGKNDDASKMRQAQELQNLYKKYGINPFGTILITFIQFPIIIAMYQAVQRSYAVTTGSVNFLGASISMETTPWYGITHEEFMYAVIFVLMGVCQLVSMMLPQWIAKDKERKEAAKHHRKPNYQANPMGNSMYMMMIPILVLSIMWPSAMTVYWTISSFINILKTLLVQYVFINKAEKKVG